jgi:RimJ/RimL family protein N-acetyltransferase
VGIEYALAPLRPHDASDLSIEAARPGRPCQAGLLWPFRAATPAEVDHDLRSMSSLRWVLIDDDGTALAVILCVDRRVIDSTGTIRVIPLPASRRLASNDGLAAARALLDLVMATLGCRRLTCRFGANTMESRLLEGIYQAAMLEGVIANYWAVGQQRYDDVLVAVCQGGNQHLSTFAPSREVFGGEPAAVVTAPWERFCRHRFESSVVSRYVRLRPITQGDLAALYELESDPRLVGWLFRGVPPSFEQYANHMRTGVLDCDVVVGNDGQLLGRVYVYDASPHLHMAKLAVVLRPEMWGQGWPFEAVIQMVRKSFHRWPLEELIFETSSAVPLSALRVMARRLRLIAHQPEDRLISGKAVDRFIFAISREEAVSATQIPALGPSVSQTHD